MDCYSYPTTTTTAGGTFHSGLGIQCDVKTLDWTWLVRDVLGGRGVDAIMVDPPWSLSGKRSSAHQPPSRGVQLPYE